jgi:hypothetical protein
LAFGEEVDYDGKDKPLQRYLNVLRNIDATPGRFLGELEARDLDPIIRHASSDGHVGRRVSSWHLDSPLVVSVRRRSALALIRPKTRP